jgi:serpin B
VSNLTSSLNFALRLHTHTAAMNPSTNIFLAPASVEANLAMAVNGARGATKRAVLQAIGLPENHSLRKLNGLQASLIAELDRPHLLDAASPSAVRAHGSIELNKAFLAKTQKFYRAATGNGNLEDRQFAFDCAGSLFNDQTRGENETIFAEPSGERGVVLSSATCLENVWACAFDPSKTKERPFTLLSGEDKRLPMMFRSGVYRYLMGDGFQAVSLPYNDDQTSMYIFVPDRGFGWERFQKLLTPENWESWMASFATAHGAIALPKFRLAYEADLTEPLSEMGIGVALDGRRADFGALCPRTRLHVSSLAHKACLDVNEQGAADGADSAQSGEDDFFMAVDRPFVCAVGDNATGTPLFLGSVVNP